MPLFFQVEVFEAVVRWCTAEIKRRLDDSDDGEVPSLGKLFAVFEPSIRFGAFTSQGNDMIQPVSSESLKRVTISQSLSKVLTY